jgi:L-threonylcarbamoyladenylate synthase
MKPSISRAADVLLGGGVIAYPTEGVYGLGCMPDDASAILRVLSIKHRDPGKGLILIASNKTQFDAWVSLQGIAIPDPDASRPITWIATARPGVLPLVTGHRESLAIRITTNPVAAAICDAVESPIVSTSANRTGKPVARNCIVLRRNFGACVDYIVPGDCGPASGPSEIRDLKSGKVLRPHKS